jgi:hypothetical protein
MKLLSFDPGMSTGWCSVYFTTREFKLLSSGEIKDGLDGFLDFVLDDLYNRASIFIDYNYVLMEDFHTRSGVGAAANTEPLKIIGAAEALAVLDNKGIVLLPPEGRLTHMQDPVLKALGVYKAGKATRNEKEAIRHAMAFLMTKGNKQILETVKELVNVDNEMD